MSDELVHGTFDVFQRLFAQDDACNSWYELSSFNGFEEIEGEEMLSWKDRGYITVFDLMQVTLCA